MKIQVFIINLERARDRKEHMQQLLKNYNFLDVSFLAAVDGKTLTNDEIKLNTVLFTIYSFPQKYKLDLPNLAKKSQFLI